MHYEIHYQYHDRSPDGKWNTEQRLSMVRKLGKPDQEISLEELAATILAQLAKRDRLVVDVEVYEYVKRKINYKEARDGCGIVLKNKRFSAGLVGGQLTVETIGDEETEQPQAHPPNGKALMLPKVPPSTAGRPITWMVFDPEIPLLHEAKQKGLKLTVRNKYAIYERVPHPAGIGNILTIVDDAGRQVCLADKYFVANTTVRLVGDNEVGGFGSTPSDGEPRLSYGEQLDMADMPNLRPNLTRGV